MIVKTRHTVYFLSIIAVFLALQVFFFSLFPDLPSSIETRNIPQWSRRKREANTSEKKENE